VDAFERAAFLFASDERGGLGGVGGVSASARSGPLAAGVVRRVGLRRRQVLLVRVLPDGRVVRAARRLLLRPDLSTQLLRLSEHVLAGPEGVLALPQRLLVVVQLGEHGAQLEHRLRVEPLLLDFICKLEIGRAIFLLSGDAALGELFSQRRFWTALGLFCLRGAVVDLSQLLFQEQDCLGQLLETFFKHLHPRFEWRLTVSSNTRGCSLLLCCNLGPVITFLFLSNPRCNIYLTLRIYSAF